MNLDFSHIRHVYFIGIGGVSMSGLAEILMDKGLCVSGSDMKASDATRHLQSIGVQVKIGHKQENITDDIDLVVYTAAVKVNNPEIIAAKEKNITIVDRAELLGRIMDHFRRSIAVSGTHGKTTTTSMISEILLAAKRDPTITIGGNLSSIQGNIRVGKSQYFVAEACEYFDSFLKFNPFIGVILNIEADHLDYFKDIEQIENSFHQFAQRIPKDGCLVINGELPCTDKIVKGLKCKVIRFSLNADTDWTAQNIVHLEDGKTGFDACFQGRKLARICLNVPGEHNIQNALAACAVAQLLEIDIESCKQGLSHFNGAQRRFQLKGIQRDIMVIDDYAHHPTEIKATLAAAKKLRHKQLWCVFQPHTYSRTKFFLEEFSDAFFDADHIVIADIFAAREQDPGDIHAKDLVEKLVIKGKDAKYLGDFNQITSYLTSSCQQGDLLITMGAGDVYFIGEAFLKE